MAPLAFGQIAAPTASAKPLAFEVVSIRPANPSSNLILSYRTTPDGYSVPGQSLFFTIMMAYFPQGGLYWSRGRLSGAPSWIDNRYAIDAKVSEADLAEWQKQGTTLDKKPMLRAMLQTLLADRCHLVAHMVPGTPIPGYSLEVGKRGPHLTESKPGETLPPGVQLFDGGVYVPWSRGDKPKLSYYGVTMTELAQHFSMMNGHPVQDQTSLTGRYDIVLNWVDDPDSKLPPGAIDSNDPDPMSHWDIETFGLRANPIKLPADTLVIDHIEKPSEN
jgi:uncharacterized protein (TIGR03435 family)